MIFSQQMDFTNETNQFMRHCGIRITTLEPQRCQAQLSVEHYCKNTGDTVHGGLLYTMADWRSYRLRPGHCNRPVTLSGVFHYLSQRHLRCHHRHRRACSHRKNRTGISCDADRRGKAAGHRHFFLL